MVIIIKEDNICLSRSLHRAQRDEENLMDINMRLEYEFHNKKAESKDGVSFQNMDYNLRLEVCFKSLLMNDAGIKDNGIRIGYPK